MILQTSTASAEHRLSLECRTEAFEIARAMGKASITGKYCALKLAFLMIMEREWPLTIQLNGADLGIINGNLHELSSPSPGLRDYLATIATQNQALPAA